jgi:chloramphenicol-sensitive protein RarD
LRGPLAAAGGYLIWGIVPIYWKQMHEISPFELIAHRVAWSLFFLLGVMAVQKTFGELRPAFTSGRLLANSAVSSVLLAANWTVYVWAVNSGHILESSLGYFLTPLGNIAMGYLFLHERLRPLQWAAIACAALGVGLLLLGVGRVPWIALTLAATWSCYAMLRKKSPLGSLAGLTVETIVLLPLAVALLLWRTHTGEGALGRVDARLHVLVLSVGVVTAIPLLLFAYGAKRLRLTTLGLLQYISPTAQFLIGLFIYHEPFDGTRFQAYALIWCGLGLYSADSFWTQRRLLARAAGVG